MMEERGSGHEPVVLVGSFSGRCYGIRGRLSLNKVRFSILVAGSLMYP